jgi:hypothetical protein
MSLTLFGIIIVLIGILLLARAGMAAMLAFVMVATLFGGSAAITLPALGGSSIPPANLALLFLILRAILPGPQQMDRLGSALRANGFLIVFAFYGVISAFIMPSLFAGAIAVTPLRPGAVRQLYEAAPLHFSSQNITTAVYLMGTLVAGIGATIGAARQGAAPTIVRTGIAIAVVHALLGFISILVAGTALETAVEFFRNGNYAQLDQSIAGLSRMNGIWPEASGFAAYGSAWMIFMTELWLRDIERRRTGTAALLLGLALLISTSSTAYVTLSGYGAILLLRMILLPGSIRLGKILALGAVAFGAALVILVAITLDAQVLEQFSHILAVMTVEKTESFSGMQRLYWAMQGLDAFVASAGLGIGAGSFRSSSLIMAIIGSMGLIGIVCFIGHVLQGFMPLRASTYVCETTGKTAVGAAASWTALLMLMPAAVASPSPDPGVMWAVFAGLALGLRAQAPSRAIGNRHDLRQNPLVPLRAHAA